MRERQKLEGGLSSVRALENELGDALGLIEMAEAENDAAMVADAEKSARRVSPSAPSSSELQSMLSGEADANDTYLEIHAGAGGTESQDWAADADAHVHALGGKARLQGRVSGRERGRGAPASSPRRCSSRATMPMAG